MQPLVNEVVKMEASEEVDKTRLSKKNDSCVDKKLKKLKEDIKNIKEREKK